MRTRDALVAGVQHGGFKPELWDIGSGLVDPDFAHILARCDFLIGMFMGGGEPLDCIHGLAVEAGASHGDWTDTQDGLAIKFDAANQKIRYEMPVDHPLRNVTSKITFVATIIGRDYHAQTNEGRLIVIGSDQDNPAFQLDWHSSDQKFRGRVYTTSRFLLNTAPANSAPINGLHVGGIRYDGSVADLWTDAREILSNSSPSGDLGNIGTMISIGNSPTTTARTLEADVILCAAWADWLTDDEMTLVTDPGRYAGLITPARPIYIPSPPIVISGSGGVTLAASLSGTGVVGAIGSGSAALALSLVGSGIQIYTGSGASSLAPSLAGTGIVGAIGSGNASLALALSGSGTQISSGSGNVWLALSLTGTGSIGADVTGTGDAALALGLSGTGTLVYSGSGNVHLAPTLSGTGTQLYTGSGAVALTLALSGTGNQPVSGSGGVALSISVTGSGRLIYTGSGDVFIAPTVTSAGTWQDTGSGAIALAPSLTGTGSHTLTITGTGAPVLAAVLAGTGTRTAAAVVGKYAAEHAELLAALEEVEAEDFSAEHAELLAALEEAGV